MKKHVKDFLIREHGYLRVEIMDAISAVRKNELIALATTGFWFLPISAPSFVYLFAPLMTGAFFLRWIYLERKFTAFGIYLRRVEWGFNLEGYGWERSIVEPGKNWFLPASLSFWIVMFLINIAISIWHASQ